MNALVFLLLAAALALPLWQSAGVKASTTHSSGVLSASPALQETIPVQDLGVTYEYGSQLTFNARIESDQAIKEVMLFITPAGEQAIMRTVDLDPDNEIHFTITADQLALRPFTNNNFHFVVILESGGVLPSSSFSFRYEDDRFEWQSLVSSDFEVWWYGRDSSFGQELIEVARQGLDSASEILAVSPPAPIRIFAYGSSRDLQDALNVNQPWIVGHAAADLGQMYIYIPRGADQRLEIERQVPHETMHFLQYQAVGEGMGRQPVWLMEGMASLAELYPNPEYQRHLRNATDRRELLTMLSLCKSFPRETFGAYQAYAQSASFVRYLFQNYGQDGLQKLMDQYNAGLGCEEGLTSAFGMSLGQLEYRWKQEVLGIDAGNLVFRNLSPYLLLLLVIVVPTALVVIPFNRWGRSERKGQQADPP